MTVPTDELADARDRRLLRAYVEGDPEAFGQLVAAHYDRMWAVALRMCRDPEEAADALQDGLISAMRHAGKYRGDAKVTTWLHRIIVNACLDRFRRRQRQQEVPMPDDLGWRSVQDPRDRISERETALEVDRALRQLPDDQRAALVLVDVEGWSVAEAAAALGIPEGTVKSRCSRGRAKLASDLQHLRNRYPGDRVEPNSEPPDRDGASSSEGGGR